MRAWEETTRLGGRGSLHVLVNDNEMEQRENKRSIGIVGEALKQGGGGAQINGRSFKIKGGALKFWVELQNKRRSLKIMNVVYTTLMGRSL